MDRGRQEGFFLLEVVVMSPLVFLRKPRIREVIQCLKRDIRAVSTAQLIVLWTSFRRLAGVRAIRICWIKP